MEILYYNQVRTAPENSRLPAYPSVVARVFHPFASLLHFHADPAVNEGSMNICITSTNECRIDYMIRFFCLAVLQ